MRNFRSLVLGLVLVSLTGVSWGEDASTKAPPLEQTNASVTCSFGKALTEEQTRRLSFTKGKTTGETLSLDGMVRATNSTYWYEVARHFKSTIFIGDFGETLSVSAPKEEAFGVYEARVYYTSLGYMFNYKGQCSLQR